MKYRTHIFNVSVLYKNDGTISVLIWRRVKNAVVGKSREYSNITNKQHTRLLRVLSNRPSIKRLQPVFRNVKANYTLA